jgi:hypothetical protein
VRLLSLTNPGGLTNFATESKGKEITRQLVTPESKSPRASGLNFERPTNLGSSRVRPAKIGLNFEISPS